MLGLPTAGVRVLEADSSPVTRAAGCATRLEPRKGTRSSVNAPAHAAAQQPCTEVGVCGHKPVARVLGATCGTDWGLPARSDASDTSPAAIVPSAQRHSRLCPCEGHPCAAQHRPESISSLSASSDELKLARAERCPATHPCQPSDIATESILAVAEPETDAHALSKQRSAAPGHQGPAADWHARHQPPLVSRGQPPQDLAQPDDTDR